MLRNFVFFVNMRQWAVDVSSYNVLFLKMDNVLIQPHISAASPHYMQLFVEELADKINNLNKSKISR